MNHWYVQLPARMSQSFDQDDDLLGKGSYGRVVPHPDYPNDWVIKRAQNDGTRTYLEWCHFMQHKKNRRLRGMPEIDWIAAQGDKHYVVCMRRYRPLWTDKEQKVGRLAMIKTAGWHDSLATYWLHQQLGCPGYLIKLVEAFEKMFRGAVNDFHRGNLMYDKARNELILTDPSCCGYRPLPTQPGPTEYFWHRPEIPELTLE